MIASDVITESAMWKLKGIIRDLTEAMKETGDLFERVQLSRVRGKAQAALLVAEDARDTLRKEGQ